MNKQMTHMPYVRTKTPQKSYTEKRQCRQHARECKTKGAVRDIIPVTVLVHDMKKMGEERKVERWEQRKESKLPRTGQPTVR